MANYPPLWRKWRLTKSQVVSGTGRGWVRPDESHRCKLIDIARTARRRCLARAKVNRRRVQAEALHLQAEALHRQRVEAGLATGPMETRREERRRREAAGEVVIHPGLIQTGIRATLRAPATEPGEPDRRRIALVRPCSQVNTRPWRRLVDTIPAGYAADLAYHLGRGLVALRKERARYSKLIDLARAAKLPVRELATVEAVVEWLDDALDLLSGPEALRVRALLLPALRRVASQTAWPVRRPHEAHGPPGYEGAAWAAITMHGPPVVTDARYSGWVTAAAA